MKKNLTILLITAIFCYENATAAEKKLTRPVIHMTSQEIEDALNNAYENTLRETGSACMARNARTTEKCSLGLACPESVEECRLSSEPVEGLPYRGNTKQEMPQPTKAQKKKLDMLKKDMITAEKKAKTAERKYYEYENSLRS